MLKLKVGDIISVHGFVMLQKLEDGCRYRVAKILERPSTGQHVYYFSRPKGKKILIGHLASKIDYALDEDGTNPDINKIVKEQP